MTAPTDFPIPADLEGFLFWDKMHCPRPQTALTQDLFNSAISKGFTGAMDEFACPVGVTYVTVNNYAYITLRPQNLGSETIEQRVERYKGTLGEVLPNMLKLWDEEWLPSILPGIKSAMEREFLVEGVRRFAARKVPQGQTEANQSQQENDRPANNADRKRIDPARW